MRWVIISVAALCYGAAIAIAGAGMRVSSVPQATRDMETAPTPVPADRQDPPSPPREPTAVPAPPIPQEQIQSAVEGLAREQASSRELVTELRATVAHLEEKLASRKAALDIDQPPERTVTVLGGDYFSPAQGTLAPGVRDLVRLVLPEIMSDSRQIVSVEGHTDNLPIRTPTDKPFKDNVELSLLRARAVADLLQRHGVPAERIRVKAWGAARPQATNGTVAGRNMNRRVEIRLLSPAPQR